MTLPITDFIAQKLLEYDPTFDVGAGTADTGLTIEPLAIILQPVADEIAVLQATGSILTILESSSPDAFPEDIVDALASNVFVTRDPGQIGSTTMRLRFFEPQAYSVQQGILIFTGPSGQRYTNSAPVTITSAQMSLNQDGLLYFVDIPTVALAAGTAFNTDIGTITSMESTPAGVANLTNTSAITQGIDRQTNTQLINLIKQAVTVRALVTGRGIIVTLSQTFTTIVEIQPIGFGDPEMMRDIVYNVHIGGNVDVYVRTTAFTETTTDVTNLVLDATRQVDGMSVAVCLVASTPYPLAQESLDRTNMVPVVQTIDGVVTYVENVDYTLDDDLGNITRLPNAAEAPLVLTPSSIFHLVGSGGTATTSKNLQLSGAFANVRPGMILTVTAPTALVGTYTIKEGVDANNVLIFGAFPGSSFPITGVAFEIDDNLVVTYQYNPVAVDVIATARSVDRASYTITNVPLMLIETVGVLDPLSGNPTGQILSGQGGYGIGGYGQGGYGIGAVADYRLVVEDPTKRFSSAEDNFIEFQQSFLGYSVELTYLYAAAVPPIQAFCDDPDNQSETASLLVKHMIPVFVDTPQTINYSIPTSTQATALTADQMATTVATFINQLGEGVNLELSDIIDLMYENGANEVDLDGLEAMVGSIQEEDGSVSFVNPSVKGIMAIPADPIPDPTTKPLSQRIARFIAHTLTFNRSLA